VTLRAFDTSTPSFFERETTNVKPETFLHPDSPTESNVPYEGVALIADPIHGYITFTVPYSSVQIPEQTEKDLIDSPWVQRLRSIYQLQSAHWVYPSAEHSRFQHSLGAMHLAGRFAKSLYPTLRETVKDLPSQTYLEELLRITALLHDIGHGPFCHFFDHHYLQQFGLTHEHLGQVIIREHLAPIIRNLTRSPSGPFAPGEQLDPDHIAFLILKDPHKAIRKLPRWLTILQPIFGGVYTADNCDYVLRDSYMCGVAIGPIDIDRLLHYSFVSSKGLTIHQAGLPALQMFLNARLYLYSNVYYHRTTRAIDIHLQEIFHQTMEYLFPFNPLDRMESYLFLTDWSLIESVRQWPFTRHRSKTHLGVEWARILNRDVKWKMAYSTLLPTQKDLRKPRIFHPQKFETQLRNLLPVHLRKIEFRIDMAHKDPRPINLLNMGGFQIFVYEPARNRVEKESLKKFFDYLPAQLVQFRIFTRDHQADSELALAADAILRETSLST
jgi:HD superfamily phosphohydrolase